eukprot:CAMPEP_0201516474 /NCGR_PEP_ID=MMETSP0161_2-20130828/7790_1 /ASSEMBLY_ACC=CAM_ASM_000251 /TAXON_ID=180227 /ORGANISM="Neoparamoeba aestuarina, Strain SoJaBio B1-5/56/2" /LENGTH=409 /DNA_ID=CAMNT_0047913619 /DNA_START=106 /DNA_END=1335 /DNA_ORIENTATION=+
MKHSAMVGMGKAQVTKDPEFDENYERIKVQKSIVGKMQTDCKRYLNALRMLSKAHYELAESIRDFYLASDPSQESLKDLSVNYYNAADQLRSIDAEVEGELQQDFIGPIEVYLAEMKSTFKKVEHRNRSRDDMDRMNRYAGHPDPEKAAQYQRCADTFTALNSELLVELPHVFRTRTEFFDPLFKSLLEVQEKCYTKLASMEQFSQSATNVNRNSIRDYKLHPEGAPVYDTAHPAHPSNTGYDSVGVAGGAAAGAAASGPSYGQPAGGPTYGQPAGGAPSYGQPAGGAAAGGMYGGGGGQTGGYGAAAPASGPTYGQPAGGPTYGQPAGGAAGGGYPTPQQPLPTAPKSNVRTVKALYQFQAEESNEISFNAGDTIIISRADEGGEWWLGKVEGTAKEGLFPSAYVTEN